MGYFKKYTLGLFLFGLMIFLTSCSVVREAAYSGVSSAVGDRVEREVEREVSGMLAGYTEAMLYQLAYTQAFMVGGYGFGVEDFNEGQGATWVIESEERSGVNRFESERALLKINDDRSTWWYLRYKPENDDSIEYEIKMTSNFDPMEMYMRDPESGDVQHHVFDLYSSEYRQSEAEMDEEGFGTENYFIEEWEELRIGYETVRVGSQSFNASVLRYEGTREEGDENTEAQWWVSEEVPGQLLKYRMIDKDDGSSVIGTLVDLKDGYTPKFARL